MGLCLGGQGVGSMDDDECQERGVLCSREVVKWGLVRRRGGLR